MYLFLQFWNSSFFTDASQQSDLHRVFCFSLSLQTGNDCVDSANETWKKVPRKPLGSVFDIGGVQDLSIPNCEKMFSKPQMKHFSFFLRVVFVLLEFFAAQVDRLSKMSFLLFLKNVCSNTFIYVYLRSLEKRKIEDPLLRTFLVFTSGNLNLPILSRFFEHVLSQSTCRADYKDILRKNVFVFAVLELQFFY